ncbi:hypothetical protein, partial [Heliomicrobium gestii]|uniref:hypothetical protein n=1 Tax=Heliomicrobium gestii TaxID=2699 RepID=UPI001A9AF1F1
MNAREVNVLTMLALIGFILILSALLLGSWWRFLQGTPFGQLPLMVVGCTLMWLITLSFPQIALLPSPYLFLVGGGLLIASVGLARTYIREHTEDHETPFAVVDTTVDRESLAVVPPWSSEREAGVVSLPITHLAHV